MIPTGQSYHQAVAMQTLWSCRALLKWSALGEADLSSGSESALVFIRANVTQPFTEPPHKSKIISIHVSFYLRILSLSAPRLFEGEITCGKLSSNPKFRITCLLQCPTSLLSRESSLEIAGFYNPGREGIPITMMDTGLESSPCTQSSSPNLLFQSTLLHSQRYTLCSAQTRLLIPNTSYVVKPAQLYSHIQLKSSHLPTPPLIPPSATHSSPLADCAQFK